MRMLLATDGSSEALQAAEWLTYFPAPDDAAVTAVTAVAPPPIPLPALRTTALSRVAGEHAERAVSDARARLAKRWPTADGSVLEGDPRDAIPDLAEAVEADLVVVGSRGLGALKSALAGSVSLAVARRAPCAVLVCRGEPRPIRHVTVALDGSDSAREALRFFERLPLSLGMAIDLVAVIQPLRYPAAIPEIDGATFARAIDEYEAAQRAAFSSALAETAAELRRAYGPVDVVLPVGSPGTTIADHAAKAGSDLVVVGARGLGTFKRVLLGSVSESVLRQSACPVLIVRRRGWVP